MAQHENIFCHLLMQEEQDDGTFKLKVKVYDGEKLMDLYMDTPFLHRDNTSGFDLIVNDTVDRSGKVFVTRAAAFTTGKKTFYPPKKRKGKRS